MSAEAPFSWKTPLVRELVVILLIKLALLFAIKTIWFDQATVPADGSAFISRHLLGDSQTNLSDKERVR